MKWRSSEKEIKYVHPFSVAESETPTWRGHAIKSIKTHRIPQSPSSYKSAESLLQHHTCLNETVCVCCIGGNGFFLRYSNFLLPIDITLSSLLSDANWRSTHATSLHWTDQSFSRVFAASEEADGSLSSYDSTAVWECSRTLQCFTEIRPRQQSHTWDSHFSSPPSSLTLTLSRCSDVLFLHTRLY